MPTGGQVERKYATNVCRANNAARPWRKIGTGAVDAEACLQRGKGDLAPGIFRLAGPVPLQKAHRLITPCLRRHSALHKIGGPARPALARRSGPASIGTST